MIAFLGPLLLFAIYVVFVASLSHTAGYLALWQKAASIAITVRLGIFWGLLALHWRGALGLWAMPLLLLLLPEGFLLPRDFVWTLPRAVFVTGLLVVGTVVWTAIAVGVVRKLRPSSACR
jgi:hypothetical protein